MRCSCGEVGTLSYSYGKLAVLCADCLSAILVGDGKIEDSDLIESDVISGALNMFSFYCHAQSKDMGWWEEYTDLPERLRAYFIVTKLALVHSELSEALEGFRKGINDDHLPSRQMVEVELADSLIRIFDLAGALNLDLGGALVEKMEYNRNRADHKLENRAKEGGKKV